LSQITSRMIEVLDPRSTSIIETNCRIDPSASISAQVRMGNNCRIGFGSRILGRVTIGDDVWIDANVTIQGNAKIGDRVYVGPNCTIGHFDRRELRRLLVGGEMHSVAQGRSVEIGNDCTIRQACVIYSSVKLGPHVEFGHNVMVREKVTIGERSLIGTGVIIDGECRIGRDVSIQTGVYISRQSKVGNRVFLGPRSVLLNDKYMMLKKTKLAGPVVGEGSAIGGNSTLLPGVRVGKMAVVGAGSVVTHNVPDRTVYVGVPAEKLKTTPKDWETLLGRKF
jgi:acetyltransferase-like isoleucine patch superfamily enzyme